MPAAATGTTGTDLLLESGSAMGAPSSRPPGGASSTEALPHLPRAPGLLQSQTPSRPDLLPLLQQRVRIAAALGVSAALVSVVLNRVSLLGLEGVVPEAVLGLLLYVYVAGGTLNAAVLAALQRRSLSERSLRRIELLFSLGNVLVWIGLPSVFFGWRGADANATALIVLLRCVLIPDVPARTLLVCLAQWGIYVLGFLFGPGLFVESLRQRIGDDLMGYTFLWDNFGIALHLALGLLVVHVVHGLRMRAFHAETAGSYRLLEKLGGGGMGEVYRARHAFLRRPTAVKVLRPELVDSPTALRRFELEVQAVSELTDPNTIAIYDYGATAEGRIYYAMEYLPGLDLQAFVERFGPMPPARAVFVLEQVLGALSEAHRRGILHRDVKPSNILLTVRGRHCDFVKVLDFGLVKFLAEPPSSPAAVSLTADGSVTGSPLYMAPERFYGVHQVDGRSDLYSVGAVAHFLLAGHAVFEASTPVQALIEHAKTPPEPLSHLGVELSAPLEQIVLRALEKDPDRRFASAEEFLAALHATPEWSGWSSDQARPWWSAHVPEVCAAASQLITAVA